MWWALALAGPAEVNTALGAGDLAAAEVGLVTMAAEGATTADVYFDLGHVRFRQGRFPEAVLAWRCAEQLAPRDEGVSAGLDRARAELAMPTGVPRWAPGWAPWATVMTSDEAHWLGGVLVGAGLLLLGLGAARPAGAVALGLGVIVGLSGVVAGPGLAVSKAKAEATSDLGGGSTVFVVMPGTELTVWSVAGGQALVSGSDGQRGWLAESAIWKVDARSGCVGG